MTKRNLIRRWKLIRARADELHRLTNLGLYQELVRQADQELEELAQPQRRKKGADHD